MAVDVLGQGRVLAAAAPRQELLGEALDRVAIVAGIGPNIPNSPRAMLHIPRALPWAGMLRPRWGVFFSPRRIVHRIRPHGVDITRGARPETSFSDDAVPAFR